MTCKFDEDKWLEKAKEWIDGTYSEDYHYAGGIDTTEFAMSNCKTLEPLQFNVSKYIWRFGRKGSNKKDLYKAIHYICMMLYFQSKKEKEEYVVVSNTEPDFVTTSPVLIKNVYVQVEGGFVGQPIDDNHVRIIGDGIVSSDGTELLDFTYYPSEHHKIIEMNWKKCPECRGEGGVLHDQGGSICRRCHGSGKGGM